MAAITYAMRACDGRLIPGYKACADHVPDGYRTLNGTCLTASQAEVYNRLTDEIYAKAKAFGQVDEALLNERHRHLVLCMAVNSGADRAHYHAPEREE